MHLTPDTQLEELVALSTPSRTSSERRRELERLASLCTDRETEISVQLTADRALARPAEADATDSYEILLPTQKYDQQETDLPPELWDRLLQVALLFHELGHVYYSDFDRFGECKREVDAQWRDCFQAIYNAAEDGVVETQVANEFNVTEDFVVLGETLAARADRRHRQYVELFDLATVDGRPRQSYTVFEALTVGLLDRGFVDSGRFAEILDPDAAHRVVLNGQRDALVDLVPALDAFMTEMLSTPAGDERVALAREFFDEVREVLSTLPPLQSERVQTAPVRPADARAEAGWQGATADQLPDEATARRHVTGDADGGVPATGGSGERASERPPGRVDEATFRRLARRRTTGRSGRVASGRSAFEREARRLHRYVVDESVDVDDLVVVDPVPDGGDHERWQAAVERSRKLRADLRTELRRERRPRDRPGHRTGRLDGRRLVAARKGRQRVFARRESGTQKDYSCLLVLDRSGSMDGEAVRTAEAATAQLSSALFAVGVDVSVMSVWRGYPCLELPFGARPAEHVDRLMTGRAEWGTPLSDVIVVARERIDAGRGSVPFTIVITDGYPDDTDRYQRQLERCPFPVLGVYLDMEPGTHSSYFDRIVYAGAGTLERQLATLVRSLFSGEA